MHIADVPVPDIPCFAVNQVRELKVAYHDPAYYMRKLTDYAFFEDLCLPDLSVEPDALEDLNTGSVLRSLTVSARTKYPGVNVLGLLLGEDGSEKGRMGQGRLRTSYPVSWTVSILKRFLRNMPRWRSLLCYVPGNPSDLKGTLNMKKKYKRMVRHLTLKFALGLFKKFADTPFPLTFRRRDGGPPVTMSFILRPLMCIADHPEAQLLSGYYQSAMSMCPCNRCKVKRDVIWSTSQSIKSMAPLRDPSEVHDLRQIANNDPDPLLRKEATKMLHSLSAHPELPGMSQTSLDDSEGKVEDTPRSPATLLTRIHS
jgi:hypothetical protein